MRQDTRQLSVKTDGPGLYEITNGFKAFVDAARIDTGLATLYCRHTSCSLLIQENADPDVQTDLDSFFRKLVPEGMDWIVHTLEGPDDMPAHIKTALTQTSLSIPILNGSPVLGVWQGIYLFEHRHAPHRREIVLHVMGE